MEKFTLNRKQIILKKNKEFFLSIPLVVNPKVSRFIIEVSNGTELKKPFTVLFHFKCLSPKESVTGEGNGYDLITTKTIISEINSNFHFKNEGFLSNEYILLGGISSGDLVISLTIIEESFSNPEIVREFTVIS